MDQLKGGIGMIWKSIVFLVILVLVSTLIPVGSVCADKAQEIDISAAPFKGPVDAPVVIVVFSDFQ